jgi:amino acid transporter
MIGMGAMIGAGIFVLTGMGAGLAGPVLTLVFVLNGVATIFTAMVYAELGSNFADAGGRYLWVKEALPIWPAFSPAGCPGMPILWPVACTPWVLAPFYQFPDLA